LYFPPVKLVVWANDLTDDAVETFTIIGLEVVLLHPSLLHVAEYVVLTVGLTAMLVSVFALDQLMMPKLHVEDVSVVLPPLQMLLFVVEIFGAVGF
jgi:hypothetical protein